MNNSAVLKFLSKKIEEEGKKETPTRPVGTFVPLDILLLTLVGTASKNTSEIMRFERWPARHLLLTLGNWQ